MLKDIKNFGLNYIFKDQNLFAYQKLIKLCNLFKKKLNNTLSVQYIINNTYLYAVIKIAKLNLYVMINNAFKGMHMPNI